MPLSPLSLQEQFTLTAMSGGSLFLVCMFLFSAHSSANSGSIIELRSKLVLALTLAVAFLGLKYYEWVVWWFSDSGNFLIETPPGSVVFAHSVLALLGMWLITALGSVQLFRKHWDIVLPVQVSSWSWSILTLLWGLMLWRGYR